VILRLKEEEGTLKTSVRNAERLFNYDYWRI